MNKQILVTGAAGFVGFHTALRLKARGDHVVGLDNFNDYYSPQLKEKRAQILQENGIKVIRGDICDFTTLEKLVKEQKITHLVHLAAQAGVRYSLLNPKAYVLSNIEGFGNILEVCRHHGLKLIYASSSSVYGTNTKVPFSIDDPTDNPASFYGATKKANEVMAFSYHHLYHVPVTGLRFFTVYGPWGRPDMAYYSFAEAIYAGKSIPLFNHGKMERDFTYIDDIVDGIVASVDLQDGGAEIFNLGNHHPETLNTFVGLLEKYIGKEAVKEYLPMQPGDVPVTYADIQTSQEKLNFNPKTGLAEGLQKFVAWFLNQKKIQSPFD